MENTKKTLTINGHEVEIGSEKNLLEMIRKIGIELPTFCYHSELSAYGACPSLPRRGRGARHHGILFHGS